MLWRRVMGTTVLAAPTSPAADVRLYAQCLRGTPGGVGLLALNTGEQAQPVAVGGKAKVWVMTAPTLDSRSVQINGQTPQLTGSGALAGMDGMAAASTLSVPAKAIAFIAVPDAGNSACR